MNKIIFALALTVSFTVAADERISVASDDARVPVVELYTSEGCSSCPPADNWLRQLGARLDDDLNDDLNAVPLAFHVDYWNYLGWRDPFSKAAFSKRQRAAPANRKRGGVYTPEFVVDGREARGANAIVRAIKNANAQVADADIKLEVVKVGDGKITARIQVDNRAGDAEVFIAVVESGIVREIGGGENRGRTLKHDFVVRHWSRPIVIRDGASETARNINLPADWRRANLDLAVVVLARDTGATVQAVRTPLAGLFAAG